MAMAIAASTGNRIYSMVCTELSIPDALTSVSVPANSTRANGSRMATTNRPIAIPITFPIISDTMNYYMYIILLITFDEVNTTLLIIIHKAITITKYVYKHIVTYER
ncbi:MAG: hypothetical protein R6V50_02260 [Thermoplasmatota archaeon]